MAQLNTSETHVPTTTVRIVFADPMNWHRCSVIAKETGVEIRRGKIWQQKGGPRVELTITGYAAAQKLALDRIEATVREFFDRKAQRRARLVAGALPKAQMEDSENTEEARQETNPNKPNRKLDNPYAALCDNESEEDEEMVKEDKEPRVSTPVCLDWTSDIVDGITSKSCTPEQLTDSVAQPVLYCQK